MPGRRCRTRAGGLLIRDTPTTNPDEDGLVITQTPPPGEQAEPGSQVILYVGRYQEIEPPPPPRAAAPARARPVSKRLRVAVIAGGRSSEHEISVESARSVIGGLDPDRYDVKAIEIHRDGRWELGPGDARELGRPVAETLPVPTGDRRRRLLGQVDVVLPILHGPFGEDGTVQGLLELAGVPYVGAGVTASALCMDKDLFKAVCRDKGIPVTRSVTVRNGDRPDNPFGYPVFVKPARLGSSVGISKVGEEGELQEAVDLARRHDEKVLIEEFVVGRRGRGRRARQQGADRVAAGRDRRPRVLGSRLVRLLGQVRRGRDGPRHPAADPGGQVRARAAARSRGVRRNRLRGDGARRLLRDGTTARCSSTS